MEVGGEPVEVDLAAVGFGVAAGGVESLQKVQARRSGLPARAASSRPTATAASSSGETIPPDTNSPAIIPPSRKMRHHQTPSSNNIHFITDIIYVAS